MSLPQSPIPLEMLPLGIFSFGSWRLLIMPNPVISYLSLEGVLERKGSQVSSVHAWHQEQVHSQLRQRVSSDTLPSPRLSGFRIDSVRRTLNYLEIVFSWGRPSFWAKHIPDDHQERPLKSLPPAMKLLLRVRLLSYCKSGAPGTMSCCSPNGPAWWAWPRRARGLLETRISRLEVLHVLVPQEGSITLG